MKIEVKNYANEKYWKTLITYFSDGKEICNCGFAYYATDGEYWISGDKTNKTYRDGRYCAGGCGSNQITAKEYIGKKVIDLLNGETNEN